MTKPFWREFGRMLPLRPRLALAALYWNLTGRRVRARNWLRQGLADAPFAYALWCEHRERAEPLVQEVDRVVARWPKRPSVCVAIICPEGSEADWLAHAIASVRAQTYGAARLIVAGSGGIQPDNNPDLSVEYLPESAGMSSAQLLAASLAAHDCDYVVPLLPGTVLAGGGLFRLVEAVLGTPGAVMAYGDHDLLDHHGRRYDPWLKPVWCDNLALAQDFFSPAVILACSAAAGWTPCTSTVSAAYDLVIDRFMTRSPEGRVAHSPYIVAHCRSHPSPLATQADRAATVQRRVESAGAIVRLGRWGTVCVDWPLDPVPPLVSIIVPTRDRVELLRACLESVVHLTDYPDYEVVVMDNQSSDTATLNYLAQIAEDSRIRVVHHDRDYNYAEINNVAVANARGEYLCLLNNDTEVIAPDWLTLMMRQAVRPGVGAVGAKLLYADRTIQHAGVVIGMGGAAGHAHRHQQDSDFGYFLQAHVQRRALAVTAACLVVSRAKFELVGGLDETSFAIAYNDVDLCLKLDATGLINIYEPRAELYHHESKSRGSDFDPDQMQRYLGELATLQARWNTHEQVDPMHHPALDRTAEHYRIDYTGIFES